MTNLRLNQKTIFLAIFFSTFLLYSNTLFSHFVWDDHYLIEENQNLKNITDIPDFFTKDFWQNSSINFQSGFYRPMTLLSFFVNYQLWQGNPFGFHLFNVILHALNGILITAILLYLTKNIPVSFVSGLIFAAHPVQTESVAYIADVNDLLCVFFVLLGIWFYSHMKLSRGKYLTLAAASFGLSLLSKENAMVGIFLLPLVDWFFISKFDAQEFKSKKWIFISALGIVLAYIAVRILVLGTDNAVTTLQNVRYVSILPPFNFWSHILTAVKIIALYIQLLFWPLNLSISYVVLPAVSLFSPDVFFAAALLLILLILVFLCRKEPYRFISFFILWFLATMVPISNLIPISNTVAERFLYLPMVGFSIFLGYVFYYLQGFLESRKLNPAWFFVVVIIVIGGFSYKTVTRNMVWQNDLSLFTSALGVKPCSPIAHRNLSAYYYRQKDMVKGLAHNQAYASCVNDIQKEYIILKKQVKK